MGWQSGSVFCPLLAREREPEKITAEFSKRAYRQGQLPENHLGGNKNEKEELDSFVC